MAAPDVILAVDGLPFVLLKPDIIYRIGRKKGLEISAADESMELAHATACILRRGVVRLAALVGKIFVNDQEKTVVDIGRDDTLGGKVKLRFGNVEARLEIVEDKDEAHDSSGFGECLKNRSINSTLDSLDIPETQPPSANTTANTTADSFFIPETQAIALGRPSTTGKESLGDDFMIPETQDMLADLPPVLPSKPVTDQEDLRLDSDVESSQGSIIRMCTQDYNEDAIDDFDSSQVLCDALLPMPPPTKPVEIPEKQNNKPDQLDSTDFEMSALNWSASNSKCGALSSTKADNVLPQGDACITPDMTAPSVDRNICTPDLFDLIMGRDTRAGSGSPDPFVRPADKANETTPLFGGIKQVVVATIETPSATPTEENATSSQDIIAAQRFPRQKLFESDNEEDEVPNQDFVATQAFHLAPNRGSNDSEPNQDFVATQAFLLPPNRDPKQLKDGEINQDFVATQAFNLSSNRDPKTSKDNEPNQDFVATQAFCFARPQAIDLPENTKDNTFNQDLIPAQEFPDNINSPRCQDFVATQPFHVDSLSLGNKENFSLHDSAKKASGTVVTSPTNPNEEAIKFFKPCVIKDKNHYQKICQIEGVFSDLSNKSRWRSEETGKGSRKRIAKSESPPATPSRKNRRISEGSQRLECNLRKRRNSVDKNSEPLHKSVCTEHPIVLIPEENEKGNEGDVPFKEVANQLQAERNQETSRSGISDTSSLNNEVSAEMKSKDNEEPKNKRARKATTAADTSKADKSKEKSNEGDASFKEVANQWQAGRKQDNSRSGTSDTSSVSNKMNIEMESKGNEEPKNKRGRKAKIAETHTADISKDVPKPKTRTRRKTNVEDDDKSDVQKGTKAKDAETSKADSSKEIPKVMTRKTRQNSVEDREKLKAEKLVKAEKTLKADSGRKAKNAAAKAELSKDIPKPTVRTRRQTTDVDSGPSNVENETTVKNASLGKSDLPKELPKPTSRTRRQTTEVQSGTSNDEKERKVNASISKADLPEDIPKPSSRTRRKASEDDAQNPNAENPVKVEKGRKPKKESTKASADKAAVTKTIVKDVDIPNEEKPARTRRKTIVENAEEKPKHTSIKRAVVRISRVSIDETLTSSTSGNSSIGTVPKSGSGTPTSAELSSGSVAAKGSNLSASGRAPRATRVATTPSVDESSNSSVTRKGLKRVASREEPSPSSSVIAKKANISADEEGLKNRSGAMTTRYSQPDPDPLKGFNQYVRKAKTTGKIRIAFTMCNRQALESVLKSLKHVVEITEDPLQCDLLIMDKGERTYKFLTVIASNKPVLSSNWLHFVKKSRCIDVKQEHLFNDAKFEETFKFKPFSVLEHFRLLNGLHFMLGEDIVPKAIEMKVIIQSAGGKVHTQPPSLAVSVDLYVVTTSKDTKIKRRLSNHEKVHFVKTEAVMQALVQQSTGLLKEYKLKL
ncbi:uncharacterized protein LOC108114016 isoform X2 [Drosophila eugracilis]|uniref:uncharacterized protein LOC108114016 isoform X2 n=1 Tax=Drosophila eugracilis TaxID=29029 RepID=UPI0007E5F8B7|nr:uncharacterized protein LOC108114016 isoform X2 [Drosophila eugracilis]